MRKVPGKHTRWKLSVLQKYLVWRANRVNYRTIHGVKSKLKYGGLCYGFGLPTAKGEGSMELRLQLAMVTRDIQKKQVRANKAVGRSSDPKRSLALGRVAVGLLFSAYGADTESGFRSLRKSTRNWLRICVAMHTGCMRFKLMKKLCKKEVLRWSQADNTFRLASDWRKMKRGGAFTVPFPMQPQFEAMQYSSYTPQGAKRNRFTAASVFQWHVRRSGSTSGHLFAPMGRRKVTRRAFQAWLRESFRRLLVGPQDEVDALVNAITPHSFRAGMASDLEREGVPRLNIKKIGRWTSDKAMEQYARDGLAQRLTTLTYKPLRQAQSAIQKLAIKAQPKKRAYSSDSEFGSSSEEGQGTV